LLPRANIKQNGYVGLLRNAQLGNGCADLGEGGVDFAAAPTNDKTGNKAMAKMTAILPRSSRARRPNVVAAEEGLKVIGNPLQPPIGSGL
jgi:hypothetical protein